MTDEPLAATDALDETVGNAAAIAPAAQEQPMSEAQLAEAKRYGRAQLVLNLADKALDTTYLAVAAFLLAAPLAQWLTDRVLGTVLQLIALYAIVILLHECFSFPLAAYSDYVLERQFGLGRQSFGRWMSRHLMRFALVAVLGGVLFVGLYAVCWATGAWWWLAAAIGFFAFSVLLGQLAPVLILPLFYKVEKLERPDLAERMAKLAEGTGLSIEGIYRLVLSEETAKANAALAGMGRTRRVLMGDTLLEGFSPDEIEVVFAHEIGHHVFGHIPKLMVAGFTLSLAGFWAADRAITAWLGPANYDPASMPVVALPMLMFVLSVFSLLMEPVQNVISRRFERQCDRYALDRTGLVTAYVSAFRKLARLNKDDPDPHPVEVFLFHSHPPISERLAMADPVGP